MKIIFLDMDGVLCTPRASIASDDTGIMSYLDPIACLLLKKLIKKTGAKLVISSTWRKFHDLNGFQAILSANCPSLGTHIIYNEDDWRTDNDGPQRGDEISRWIEKRSTSDNPVEKFIILDDDSDMGNLMPYLVKCDCYDGFGFRNYRDALELLGGKDVS